MSRKIFYPILILAMASPLALKAQEDWELEGDVQDAEIVIEKDLKITLPTAIRNFEKVPPLPYPQTPRTQSYKFKNYSLSLSPLNPGIRILTMKPQPLSKLYGNYFKAGYGNYQTPYLEGFFNNKRSNEYSLGLHFRHLSSAKGPVDDKNSGNGETILGITGETFNNADIKFKGGLNYSRHNYHFYGYDQNLVVERDSIEQIFNRLKLTLGLGNMTEDGGNSYHVGLSFDYLSDAFNAQEIEVGLRPEFKLIINENLDFHLDTEVRISQKQDDLSSFNRHLIRAKPYVEITGAQVQIKIGANLVWENDTISGGDRLHFYPIAHAIYDLSPSLAVYGEVKGDILRRTLNSMSSENPYLDREVGVFNTNEKIFFTGGIKGGLRGGFGYNAGLSWGNYGNMYFFANSGRDSTRFEILYDRGSTSILNFFGEIQFSKGETFRNALRGDFYNYETEDLAEAWHKPAYKASYLMTYNLYQKIMFNLDLYLMGGIKGLNLQSSSQKELDSIVDLNLKADYLVSEQFSVFISGENLLSKKFERYLNYPSRGLQVLAGVSVSF